MPASDVTETFVSCFGHPLVAVLLLVMSGTARGEEIPRGGEDLARDVRPQWDWAPVADRPPVLFLSDEQLERLKQNVARDEAPFREAWQHVLRLSEHGMAHEPAPYAGEDFVEMRFAGFRDFHRAQAMALRWRVTGEKPYADRARQVLLAWATHEPMVGTTPLRITADQQPPWGKLPDIGLNFAYLATSFAHVYTILHPHLSPQDVAAIEPWLRYMADEIAENHRLWLDSDCFGRQYYNNHLSFHNLGLAAIGFALRDEQLVRQAYARGRADWFDMLCGTILMPDRPVSQFYERDPSRDTRPGEVYDRYRILTVRDGKRFGIPYSFMHLKGLLYAAEIAYNNGIDLYGFTGPHGQNLAVAFEQLAPYLITGDPAYHGDYHANDLLQETPRVQYEIKRLRLGDRPVFRRVLQSGERAIKEPTILGYDTPLLYGAPLSQ
jgi:hypothetical protein